MPVEDSIPDDRARDESPVIRAIPGPGRTLVGGQPGSFLIPAPVPGSQYEDVTTNPTNLAGDEPGTPFCRPVHGRLLAGVASALAAYVSVDVAIVRIAFVVLALLGGIGLPAYLAGWVLIPDEGETVSLAEAWLHRHHERAA